MTNKEIEYLKTLENCFEELLSEHHRLQEEMEKRELYIEKLKALCIKHNIDISSLEPEYIEEF